MQRASPAAANGTCVPVTDLGTTVVAPAQLGLVAVTGGQACALKRGAAVKCLLSFDSGALVNATEGGQMYLVLSLDAPGQVAIDLRAVDVGLLGRAKAWIALGILVLMLAGIASERVHRMWCSFAAAFAMMAVLLWAGIVPSLAMMTEWLDESTLGLLFGMMLIVGQLKKTGLFEVLCAATLRVCGGRMWLLVVLILYLTGFISAFLDNVTTMLLMGPISIAVMRACSKSPVPLLVAQALMSNIGGTATMVGDPPNIIIGNALAHTIGFGDFIVHLAPGVIAASVPATLVMLWLWRADLMGRVPQYESCLELTRRYAITDWDLLAKAGFVTVAVVGAFLLHPLHHVDPAVFAIMGATLLCIVAAPMDAEGPLKAVELDMLLFFAAQFVMVEAASELGLIDMLGGWLAAAIRAAPQGARTIVAIQILLWGSALISAVLDNIPFTITMVPVIEFLASAGLGLDLTTMAWTLAFGACFGGNATLIGASANIVTATMLDKAGHHVTFNQWLRYGAPVMVVSVAVANLYLFRYAF